MVWAENYYLCNILTQVKCLFRYGHWLIGLPGMVASLFTTWSWCMTMSVSRALGSSWQRPAWCANIGAQSGREETQTGGVWQHSALAAGAANSGRNDVKNSFEIISFSRKSRMMWLNVVWMEWWYLRKQGEVELPNASSPAQRVR